MYEVSDLGNVRSLKGSGEVPRLMTLGVHAQTGYLRVTLSHKGKWRPRLVHRLVLLGFRGEPKKGADFGCHRNGIRNDNRLVNLYWGTPPQNTLDQVAHGTHRNSSKTHCERLHEFTPENTYIRPGGQRQCLQCKHDKAAEAIASRGGKRPSGRVPKLTEDEQLEMINLRVEGVSYKELSARYGMSQGSLCSIFKRHAEQNPELDRMAKERSHKNLGVKPKVSEEDKIVIRRLHGEGWIYSELAEHYGVSRSTISNICKS